MVSTRYTGIEVIGRGAFGEVARATQHDEGGFERTVALKWLADAVDDEGLARLRAEAWASSQVQHRAAVRVERIERVGDRWALVMEYVPGAGLHHLLHLGPVPVRAAFEICAEVAGALAAAHPLMHRDLSPANLRITTTGGVKLLDFGLASLAPDARDRSGTPGYRSPERLTGSEAPPSDVYALGCVLYAMLAGRPFGRTSPREAAHRMRVQAALRDLDGLGEEQIALVEALLEFDPEQRPTAREVRSRADALAGGGLGLVPWSEQALGFFQSEPTPAPGDLRPFSDARPWTARSAAASRPSRPGRPW